MLLMKNHTKTLRGRFLPVLFLILGLNASGQIYQPINAYGYSWQGGEFARALGIPSDTVLTTYEKTKPHFAIKNGAPYYWSISLGYWVSFSAATPTLQQVADAGNITFTPLIFQSAGAGGFFVKNFDGTVQSNLERDFLKFTNSAHFVKVVPQNTLSGNYTLILPNANGTFALSVNGHTPDATGAISLTIPSPQGLTDVLGVSGNGGSQAITNVSSVGLGDATHAGDLRINDGGGNNVEITASLTGSHSQRVPDADGTFAVSVSGVAVDGFGNAAVGLQEATDVNASTTNELTIQGARLGADAANGITFFGSDAASGNTGSVVVAFGNDAASGNTGNDVVAIGGGAGNNNTGNDVVAIGGGAGSNNTGSSVTIIGSGAGSGAGDNVTAIGYNAGGSGHDNVIIGVNALIGSSHDNVAIGNNASASIFGHHDAIIIGHYATTDNNNQIAFKAGTYHLRYNLGGFGADHYGVTSINGNYADATGDVTIATGSGLADVLTVSDDGGGNSITNVGDINANGDISAVGSVYSYGNVYIGTGSTGAGVYMRNTGHPTHTTGITGTANADVSAALDHSGTFAMMGDLPTVLPTSSTLQVVTNNGYTTTNPLQVLDGSTVMAELNKNGNPEGYVKVYNGSNSGALYYQGLSLQQGSYSYSISRPSLSNNYTNTFPLVNGKVLATTVSSVDADATGNVPIGFSDVLNVSNDAGGSDITNVGTLGVGVVNASDITAAGSLTSTNDLTIGNNSNGANIIAHNFGDPTTTTNIFADGDALANYSITTPNQSGKLQASDEVTPVTADYAIPHGNVWLEVDGTATIDLTFPSVATNVGQKITLHIASTGGAITTSSNVVKPDNTAYTTFDLGAIIVLESNGTNWVVVSRQLTW